MASPEPVLQATYIQSYQRGLRNYTIVASIVEGFTLVDDGETAHDIFWVHAKDPKDAVKALRQHYKEKDNSRSIGDVMAVFSGFHSPEIK